MIPFFEQPSIRIGPISIHAFGIIVAGSVLTGLELGRRRFDRLGLDKKLGEGFAWYVVVGGFLGAHVFSVLFYFPEELMANPLILLRLWEDISSFGGILGGTLAISLFFHRIARRVDPVARWRYVDVAAYVFPVSLAIGRVACSFSHDHPGNITDFPLAVSLATPAAQSYIRATYVAAGRSAELPSASALSRLGFHDLGWYELLYLMVLVVPVTIALGRRPRPAGAFLVSFLALYMPVRFGLDFLRVSDARYVGLTPAQWAALLCVASLPVVWSRIRGDRSRGGLPWSDDSTAAV